MSSMSLSLVSAPGWLSAFGVADGAAASATEPEAAVARDATSRYEGCATPCLRFASEKVTFSFTLMVTICFSAV